MVRSGSDRTHPDVRKRSFGFDLVSVSLGLLGGVRKVKFRLLQFLCEQASSLVAANKSVRATIVA
jgi:hypothetical protein